jgi:hypothetical protein
MASIVDGGRPNNTIRFIRNKKNNLTRFYFKLTITMLFSYLVGNNESATTKNAGESLAISIAMSMRRYDAGRIAR